MLVHSEPVHYRCWNEVLASFGIELDWDTYASTCIGISDRVMLERLGRLSAPPIPLEQLIAKYPEKKRRFLEMMAAGNPFTPEMSEFIKSLDIYQLAVVTSSGRSEVEPILEAAGVREFFRAAVYGLDAGKLKPAPEPYLLAARLLGAKQPLVVEDSDAGVASGLAAGFDVLRVASSDEVPEAVRRKLQVTRSHGQLFR